MSYVLKFFRWVSVGVGGPVCWAAELHPDFGLALARELRLDRFLTWINAKRKV